MQHLHSIDTFHGAADQCDEAKCHIGRSVIQTLTPITEILCGYIDDRYKLHLVLVGSAADGSKLFLPDEFDFLLVVLHRQFFDDLCQSGQSAMLKKTGPERSDQNHGLRRAAGRPTTTQVPVHRMIQNFHENLLQNRIHVTREDPPIFYLIGGSVKYNDI